LGKKAEAERAHPLTTNYYLLTPFLNHEWQEEHELGKKAETGQAHPLTTNYYLLTPFINHE